MMRALDELELRTAIIERRGGETISGYLPGHAGAV